jgi:hypothetical protein
MRMRSTTLALVSRADATRRMQSLNTLRAASGEQLAPLARTRAGSRSEMCQNAKYSVRADIFRFALEPGHCAKQRALRIWANARSRCAPARCAGARAERPVAGREDSASGVPGQHDQQGYCWRATHDPAARILMRPANAMIKIALTKAPTSLLECAVYILATIPRFFDLAA